MGLSNTTSAVVKVQNLLFYFILKLLLLKYEAGLSFIFVCFYAKFSICILYFDFRYTAVELNQILLTCCYDIQFYTIINHSLIIHTLFICGSQFAFD